MAPTNRPQLGIDIASPVAQGFEFVSSSLAWRPQICEIDTLRGTRSHSAACASWAPALATGTIEMSPNAQELARLLPWILGAEAESCVYCPTECLSNRTVTVDKVTQVSTYTGCLVGRAVFYGRQGSDLQLSIDVVGTGSVDAEPGTFPSVDHVPGTPFRFADCEFTLLGADYRLLEFALTIDNHLEAGFFGSPQGQLTAVDRTVRFACACPFVPGDQSPATVPLVGGSTSLIFSSDDSLLTFSLPTWQVPLAGPQVPARQQSALRLNGVARRTDTSPELVITLENNN